MGESSDGEDCLIQGMPATLGNISALELHSVESSPLLLVLLVLVLLVGVGQGDSGLLLSNIEPCPPSRGSDLELQCLKKVLLQLSIIHGKSTQSDTMETFVTHVQEPGGASRALHVPYRITIYKSDINAQYPITYVQSFNENPKEVAISSHDCRDGHNDPSPNCGWLYNNDGDKVKDSQGFCCWCNISGSLPNGPGSRQYLRMVEEDCNVTFSTRRSFPTRRPGSAHCLRYPTYQLGKPVLSISVKVVVQMMHLRPGQLYGSRDTNSKIIHFNNQQSTLVYPNEALKAHLQGDFEFNIQMPTLQDQYLSIPMEEGRSEKVSCADQWLTLPKNYFTLDGQECDKIGVSYKAFKFQAKACNQPVQSCCGNQINVLAQEDSQRMLAGEAPKYAFSQYGKAVVEDGKLLEPPTLNLHIDKEKVSILTVELEADDLQYYNYRSTGKILKADVERFETGIRRVLLLVEVVNMGITRSYFKIKVVDCTTKVDILPAEIVTLLVPAIPSSFWLTLRIRGEGYSFNANTISCKVILFHHQKMSKEVEKLVEIPLPDHHMPQHVAEPDQIKWSLFNYSSWCFVWCNNTQSKTSAPGPTVTDPCVRNCTKLFDAACFVKNWCGQQLLKMIGMIIAMIAGLFIIFLMYQSGTLALMWECFSVCIGTTTSKASKAGRSVARAQKKRQKKRMREHLKEDKDTARADFLNEKFMDEEDEDFDRQVLGKKGRKKGGNNRRKRGRKGTKGKRRGKKKGTKGKRRSRKKKREYDSDSDERRKRHSDSEENSENGSDDDNDDDSD